MFDLNEAELSRVVTEAAMEIHRDNGSGQEGEEEAASFRALLTVNLRMRGLVAESRVVAPGRYQGVKISRPQPIPLIVNDLLLVDVYAEPKTNEVLEAKALAKLHLTGLRMALVVNFGERKIRDGIRRVMNLGIGGEA